MPPLSYLGTPTDAPILHKLKRVSRGNMGRQKPNCNGIPCNLMSYDGDGVGKWWARQESNPQPSRYERPALTVELQAPRSNVRVDSGAHRELASRYPH
jgi:hypothetical protein